jgi:hypothetical protein
LQQKVGKNVDTDLPEPPHQSALFVMNEGTEQKIFVKNSNSKTIRLVRTHSSVEAHFSFALSQEFAETKEMRIVLTIDFLSFCGVSKEMGLVFLLLCVVVAVSGQHQNKLAFQIEARAK